jgi:hypothetical protein
MALRTVRHRPFTALLFYSCISPTEKHKMLFGDKAGTSLNRAQSAFSSNQFFLGFAGDIFSCQLIIPILNDI